MNLNHDVHSSPKENYLNGSINDFTDCIDFTKQYQKSCGYEDINVDGVNDLNESSDKFNKLVVSENSISDLEKQHRSYIKENNEKKEFCKNLSVNDKEVVKNEFQSDRHPMEPDVSITVGESNLEKTINHVAKGIKVKASEQKFEDEKSSENFKVNVNKNKLTKKNNLKLPASKNIKKKASLYKLKNGKFVKKKNESFQYQGVQSNIKFKCYKCSNSDFSSISELHSHQRKCITDSPDFQPSGEPSPSFSHPSTSSNFRITRKVYLCSACGSYYENWNLFLHMKEMHKRHICLYCLGMFSLPDKLAQHLQTKHNVVEQNLSSTEEFLKLYRGTCYLICVSCEAMFSEQENFFEHSCISSNAEELEGSCPLCGLQGAHFPTCRRAFSDRYQVEPDSQKSHPALGKKLSNKKKKIKGNKKGKEVFRIVNNEHNGEMSVIVRKENSEGLEGVNDSRPKDSYLSGQKESSNLLSPLENSSDDLVSTKQYNEKMLQLYRSNKPSEKIISSIQSIEDSINRVVKNSQMSDEEEKENREIEEEEEDENENENENPNCNGSENSSLIEKANGFLADQQSLKTEQSNEPVSNKNEESRISDVDDVQIKSMETTQSETISSATNSVKNCENPVLSDSESTDSEKLTIAIEQPCEQSGEKIEIKDTGIKNNVNGDSGCEKYDDNIPMASVDTPYIFVFLKENTDQTKFLIREFVKISCWNCVYCSHAKRIAVNGKQLALHILAEHRFVTVKEDATNEEKKESALTIIQKLKNSLSSLENCYFNTDTFDSEDKEFWKANDRIYECFHCLFATYVHKELYSHNRKMHQKAVFLCIMCKSNFYNYSELLCHLCPGIYIAGQVINPDITYRCFLCNVDPLPSSFRLMVHLRRKHNSCDICFDLSSNQFQLSTHVWKHKLSHMCYRCGIAYRNKPDITKHLFWKHGTESVLCKKCLQKKWPHVYHFCVPPNSFICDECSISLKSAVALKVHKRLHSGDYPYPCDKCDEKFISRKLLGKHLDKHEEEDNRPLKTETPEPEPTNESNTVEDGKSLETDVTVSEEVEKKPEKEKKPKKKKVLADVFDLPPVNLSESDDSEEDETDLKPKPSKPESPLEETQLTNGYLNGDAQKEEPSPTQIVDGVWNNFQNYLVAKDMPKTFRPGSPFKNMTISRIKEIMLSDHDYYIIPSSSTQETNFVKEEEKPPESKKVGLDHDYCNNLPKSKTSNKLKQKAKHKDEGSSSSDSSSDSDSSCSCGSNCSCSSGSSSSTSSNDSDSDSREKRKQKKNSKETKVLNEVEPEVPTEVDVSVQDVLNEKVIHESDLETDETETDEDFYDYNPAREANRILAEKRTQLLANLNGSDAIASSPSIGMEKTSSPKRKLKIKRKRSLFRASNTSRGKRKKNAAIAGTPFNSVPPTQYVPETSVDSVGNPVYDVSHMLPYNRPKMEDSVLSSGEGDSKRPKRKRVPLKFYGFSSDDENDALPAPRKRDKTEHNTTTPAPSVATTPSVDSSGEVTPVIWNPNSKNSLSWRVEKSEPVTPKVNPIKIRTSQNTRQTPIVETPSGSDLFQIKRMERTKDLHVNGNSTATATATMTTPTTGTTAQKGEKLYCFCQCPYDEVSEMIACDAEDCVIEWFHFECVGIMVPPKGSWYCPECRKKLAAENEFLSSPVSEQNVN